MKLSDRRTNCTSSVADTQGFLSRRSSCGVVLYVFSVASVSAEIKELVQKFQADYDTEGESTDLQYQVQHLSALAEFYTKNDDWPRPSLIRVSNLHMKTREMLLTHLPFGECCITLYNRNICILICYYLLFIVMFWNIFFKRSERISLLLFLVIITCIYMGII